MGQKHTLVRKLSVMWFVGGGSRSLVQISGVVGMGNSLNKIKTVS
jgi:hypothetical protein